MQGSACPVYPWKDPRAGDIPRAGFVLGWWHQVLQGSFTPHTRSEGLVDLPRSWTSFLSWSMNINWSVESAAHGLLIQNCIPSGAEL